MPTRSAKMTRTGRTRVEATTRGTTRYLTGFVARVTSASICSVTFIVPSSAAIDAPTPPQTITPPTTRGPPDRLGGAPPPPVRAPVPPPPGGDFPPPPPFCLTLSRIPWGGGT